MDANLLKTLFEQEAYSTVIQNSHGEVAFPFTLADYVLLNNDTLAERLETIEARHQQYVIGTQKVGHAVQTDKFERPVRLTIFGGATGEVQLDGSRDVSMKLAIEGTQHEHLIANVAGLQRELDGKLSVAHDHEHWHTFGEVLVDGEALTSTQPADVFKLEAKDNIVLSLDSETNTIGIGAVLSNVSAVDSRMLVGTRIDSEADVSTNERFVATARYGDAMKVGQTLHFNLANSQKEYDVAFGIGTDRNVYATTDGVTYCNFWHDKNHGTGSGLDADKLDGKDATAFSLITHHHNSDYATLDHTHDYLLGKTEKAADSHLLDGDASDIDATPETIVKRDAAGGVNTTAIAIETVKVQYNESLDALAVTKRNEATVYQLLDTDTYDIESGVCPTLRAIGLDADGTHRPLTATASESYMGYHRMGELCHIQGKVTVTAVNDATGELVIEGLPYFADNSASTYLNVHASENLNYAPGDIPILHVGDGCLRLMFNTPSVTKKSDVTQLAYPFHLTFSGHYKISL